MSGCEIDSLVAPFRYQIAQAEKKTAYERYNYASVALELATIRERFAELCSQFYPVEKIKAMKGDERDRLCASAYYVMYGRLPKEATDA